MKSYKSIEIKCFSPEEYQKAKEKAQKKQSKPAKEKKENATK